jgi:putative FmdB family regulatory protein
MPLYEYTCRDCGESFEKIVRFSEADQLPNCPACGQENTRKKISAGAVIGAPSGGRSAGGSAVTAPRFT